MLADLSNYVCYFSSTIMMISIFNSGQLFETRECALVRLPDGREGAIWRGLAYPLELLEQRIEMGVKLSLQATACTGTSASKHPKPISR